MIPKAAIEAAAEVLRKFHAEVLDDDISAALEAAMPAIREDLEARFVVRMANAMGRNEQEVRERIAEQIEQIRVYVETDEFWTERNRQWVRGELWMLLDGDVTKAAELL